ncbi:hypothetical protein [Nocardia gipuzkoensis]
MLGGGAQRARRDVQARVGADGVVDGAHRQAPVRGLFGDEQRDLFGPAAQQAAAFSQPGDQGGAGTRLQRHGPRAAAGVGDRQCPGPFG